MAELDPETLDRWRKLGPRAAFLEAREALHRLGATSSEDFLEAYEEMVREGVLTWEEIESFESEDQ